MSTVIRATGPAELLGLIPALAGFTPRHSLVLVPFQSMRSLGAMRLDLPPAGADPLPYAQAAWGALAQIPEVDAVAVVVYSGGTAAPSDGHPPTQLADASPEVGRLPQHDVIDALCPIIERGGVRVVDALCISDQAWADYHDPAHGWHPLSEIPAPPVIPGLGDLSADQCAGAVVVPAPRERRTQVAAALAEVDQVLRDRERGDLTHAGSHNPQALVVGAAVLDDLPRFAEELLHRPGAPQPHACAALLWVLGRPALRDAVLVQWATHEGFGRRALRAQLAFSHDGEDIPDQIGRVFLGQGHRPDADRLGCALEVVRQALSAAPKRARPGALTAAGWLAWALGRSSHAHAYVQEALRLEPGHSMAALIATMLGAGILPEWALRRP